MAKKEVVSRIIPKTRVPRKKEIVLTVKAAYKSDTGVTVGGIKLASGKKIGASSVSVGNPCYNRDFEYNFDIES